MAEVTESGAPAAAPRGLSGWMRRALEECDRAERGFDPDAVHDLRVALRRCRSMGEAVERIDPEGEWRALRRTARPLFRALGGLRDVHVTLEWTRRLAPPDDPLLAPLVAELLSRERRLAAEAAEALAAFDRKRWKGLARKLPKRLSRIRVDGPVFETIAVERWTEAFDLHRRALANRSRIGWHRLRIGIKRLRYVVENFLPTRESAWGADLRRLQDLLGEVHDLDVLQAELLRLRPRPSLGERGAWVERIAVERKERLSEYRKRAVGGASVWTSWREGLPDGAPLRAASLERLAFQASSLDPEPERARHIRRLALDLAQGLFAAGLGDVWGDARALQALAASALLQDAGRTRKAAAKRILEIPPPPGWTAADMERTALVARYRRGAEPEPDRDDLASLDEADRRIVASLAAVLRLADALDPGAEARVLRVDVEVGPEVVHVLASGYQDDARAAARIARAKHLLEKVTGRVFVVRGHPIRPRLVSPAQPSFRRTPTG